MAREGSSVRTVKVSIASLVKTLLCPELALILRIYLGVLFLYASISKINNPVDFAEAIANYQIVPYLAVNSLSVILPWMELICGIFLVVGFRSKSASLFISLMLISFILAAVITLMRGISIGCGCFDAQTDDISWLTVGRDMIWLLMSVHVFFFDEMIHIENIRFLHQ